MRWTKSRCKEIDLLRKLLLDISGINHGSNALGKLAACERIAARLTSNNIDQARSSFLQFLVECAAEDRATSRTLRGKN